MVTAILKIVELLLGMLDRYLEEQADNAREIEDEKYRKAVASGDFGYAAYLLNRRMRAVRRTQGRPKGPGADNRPS